MIRSHNMRFGLSATMTLGLLVLLVISTAEGSAWKSAGITTTFPTGARALAMGDATCGSGGDLGAMHYNPATLSGLAGLEISGFYERRLTDDSFTGIQLACPAGLGVLGLSLLHYTSGDIELLASGGDTRVVLGQRDYSVALRYAIRPREHLSIGIGLKVLRSTLADECAATGIGSEIGWLFESRDGHWSLGGSATNIGANLKYKRQTEDIPWIVRLGGDYAVQVASIHLQIAGDLVRVQQSDLREHVGIESVIGNYLAVRAGYKFGYENAGWTYGFGLQVGRLQLDHGIGVSDRFDDIHLTQVSYTFY